jgi:hypothetical protein
MDSIRAVYEGGTTSRLIPREKLIVEITVSRDVCDDPTDSKIALVIDVYRCSCLVGEIDQTAVSVRRSAGAVDGPPISGAGVPPGGDERHAAKSADNSRKRYLNNITGSRKSRKSPSERKVSEGL